MTLTERHVQAIWYDRALRPPRLFAVGRSAAAGGEVRVVDPGVWNLGAGPDFLGAVLEVGPDRRRLAGDVEIHLSPSDWEAHRHGDDPAYGRVVVHVTWRCGPPPSSLPPDAVSIWLGRYLTAETGFSPDAIDLGAYPFARLPSDARRCLAEFESDPARALRLLESAGRRRLLAKAGRMRRLLGEGADREQLFYAEVMGALGYHRNQRAFRALAAIVPFRTLLSEPDCAESALLAAAPFVSVADRGRPTNRPARRLAAAARLFTTTSVMSLMDMADFSRAACRRCLDEISAGHLVGRGRSAAVLANVIVPWALAEGRLREPPPWLPPEDISAPVRLMAFRLLGRDHNPSAFYTGNDLLIQGLLEICNGFCLCAHPDCEECRLFDNIHDI